MEYITLTKGDPEFESYLLGTFDSKSRALPVETFEGKNSGERVTFRIVPLDKLNVPPWWKVYFLSIRPELAGLTLGPAAAAWLNHSGAALSQWTRWPSWLALLGIFFLFAAACLYNDYQDHMQGGDRRNRQRGSQVIQKGWVTAIQMRRWAVLNAALALVFGVPAFFNAPLALSLICLGAAVAIFIISQKWGLRAGLVDLSLMLLFGPLLTCGIALASYSDFNSGDIFLGVAFGLLTVWVFHLRQLEFLFRARPESFRTFLGFLPFEKVRLVLVMESALVVMAQLAAAVWLRLPFLFFPLSLFISLPLWICVQRIWQAGSPLSSSLMGISWRALIAHLGWTVWWLASLGVVNWNSM